MSNTAPFPCYRRLKKTYYNSDQVLGTIVEFTGNKEGTVVYSPPNGRYDVGTFECTWVRYDDVECWEVCDKPDPIIVEKTYTDSERLSWIISGNRYNLIDATWAREDEDPQQVIRKRIDKHMTVHNASLNLK